MLFLLDDDSYSEIDQCQKPEGCVNADYSSYDNKRLFSTPSTLIGGNNIYLIRWTGFYKVVQWHFLRVVDKSKSTFVKFLQLQDSVYQKLPKSVYFWLTYPRKGVFLNHAVVWSYRNIRQVSVTDRSGFFEEIFNKTFLSSINFV